MYSFLNDNSMSPHGVVVPDCRPLLRGFLDAVYTLHHYGIEMTRVPNNFPSLSIAGSSSISELYSTSTDADEKKLIISFLGNRIEDIPSKNAAFIEQEESKSLFEIYCDGSPSELLKEAYVMNLPTLSFATKQVFASTTLSCQKYILTEQGGSFVPESIHNIFSTKCHSTHSGFLLKINHDITFSSRRFNPANEPCWRANITREILQKYNYPNCLTGFGTNEKRAINMEIAPKVLDANGWEYSHKITELNKDRPEVWKVYTNKFGGDIIYISVDLGEGEFEIQNRNGKWIRTVFFDGTDTGKDYSKYRNSKNKDGHHINIK